MGQKTNANALRYGINKKAYDCFYAERKKYADFIHSHRKVRSFLMKKLEPAGISRIFIERPGKSAQITIYAARPGMIIGKKGSDIDSLRKELSILISVPTHVVIKEVRKPDLDVELVAKSIASQLQKRVMVRRAMRRAVQSVLKAGAQGVRVCIAGRLGGAEIASTKWYHEGRLPLHTLRADIDYAFTEAKTTYGLLGVKVWIFKGEVVKKGADHVNAETNKV